MIGTTLILSVRSSVFLFHKFYQEHMTVRLADDFWHHHVSFDQKKKKICSCMRIVMDILRLIAFKHCVNQIVMDTLTLLFSV